MMYDYFSQKPYWVIHIAQGKANTKLVSPIH